MFFYCSNLKKLLLAHSISRMFYKKYINQFIEIEYPQISSFLIISSNLYKRYQFLFCTMLTYFLYSCLVKGFTIPNPLFYCNTDKSDLFNAYFSTENEYLFLSP